MNCLPDLYFSIETNKTRKKRKWRSTLKKLISSAFLEKMLFRTYQNGFDTQKKRFNKEKSQSF